MFLIANDEGKPGIERTVSLLRAGTAALDAIEEGIRMVELDPAVRSVGYNSWPNLIGELELDAAVMDGDTLRTGAVGALKGYRHPVSVARQVLERIPFEMLVGEGAARFAAEIGAEPGAPVSADSLAALRQFLELHLSAGELARWPDVPLIELSRRATEPQRNARVDPGMYRDTTVYIASDARSNLCVATSTSGWAWKYPGRLGDSPLIGAAAYADSQVGAAACTHTGEMTIRAETAHGVVTYLKCGLPLGAAVDRAVDDLRRLKGGLIAGVTIHAVLADGEHRVVHARSAVGVDYWRDEIDYWYWNPTMERAELRRAEVVAL